MWEALRLIVGAFGAVMVATGLLLFAAGGEAAWSGAYALVVGAVAVATALFERSRYARTTRAQERLRATDERFIDPTSGQRIRVWIDPASGERTYLPDGDVPQK
jgi:cell division protein FtsW (lipid II flippase)